MVLLDAPPVIFPAFFFGIFLAVLFGFLISRPDVWLYLFPPEKHETYLKAGEYGEADEDPSKCAGKSIFKEPANAMTSLTYSIFGVIMFFTGVFDYKYSSQLHQGMYSNVVQKNPGFSILFGISCIYLGISSCLFHASHTEAWRKADAGMTSGVMAAPVILAIWDRARPYGVESSNMMVLLAIIFQFSLTHGYLPYGSSDVLLPTLVLISWALELLPRYGGVIDAGQYQFWYQSTYAVVGGMLLRVADLRRNVPNVFTNVMYGFFFATIVPFGYLLGFSDIILYLGFGAGIYVYHNPARGHIFWHFGSAYALFVWWYMYRLRPGDPVLSRGADNAIILLLFFVTIKNAFRRIFMAINFKSNDLRDRIFILLEHIFFGYWGYYILVLMSARDRGSGSWVYDTILCWVNDQGHIPLGIFNTYYLANTATHIEDCVYAIVLYIKPNKEIVKPRDIKMDIHHAATALLCLSSYYYGYTRIGSIIMLLHDVSDISLDLLRLVNILRWEVPFQIFFYLLTLVSWIYWRLWYFPFVVMYSIAYESKSMITDSDCEAGQCTWDDVPERTPFLLLLFILLLLHSIWFAFLLKKGYRELFSNNLKTTKSESEFKLKHDDNAKESELLL